MGARYWLNRGTAAEGPYGEEQILELIAGGLRAANVCADGTSAWQPLGSVSSFAAAVASRSPGAPAPGPAAIRVDDPRALAIVSRGYGSRLGCMLAIVLFLVVGLTVGVFVVLQQSHDLATNAVAFAVVAGVWLLGAAFFGRARIVADAHGIGRALGRRRAWADYERDEPTKRISVVTNVRTRSVTRTTVHGTRFHFRGGRTFLAEDTISKDVPTQVRAYGRLAAARAQPARAGEILAGMRSEELDAWSAPPRPRFGGRFPSFALGSAALLLLALDAAAYVSESARRAELASRPPALSSIERRARADAEAARAAITYPTSPGIPALAPEAVCPLLVAWDLSCRRDPDPTTLGLRDIFEVHRAGEAGHVSIWAFDFARADGPRQVGDERAFFLTEAAGDDAERALFELASHRFRSPDEFVAALRAVHLRTPGADSIYGRGAFVCFQSEVHFRAGRRWLRGCDWAAEPDELASTRVERAGDRVLVIRGDSVSEGNTLLGTQVRDILVGTATPPAPH